MNWKEYEQQVFEEFNKKYGKDHQICYNIKKNGMHSKVKRQIDIYVAGYLMDVKIIGVFDCKYFNKKVNVKVIDSMVGFIDDIGADFGGVVTTKGFSEGAKNRAKNAKIDLRVIEFESAESVIESFVPSLDFSDKRNSMYLTLI